MGWTFRQSAAVITGAGLWALSAGAVLAQVEDPIGALLDSAQAPMTTAPAQPAPAQTAAPAPTAAPVQTAPAAAPPAPSPVTPPSQRGRVSAPITPPPTPLSPRSNRDRPTIASQPVFLDAPDPLGAPLNAEERSYEARLRASFESAQGLQGPLDGGWVLSAANSGDLYAMRFVDRGSDALEAAWRDLRRPGALDASGFVDNVQRAAGQVVLRFTPRRGAPPTVITLNSAGDGLWSGELVEDGAPRGVVMRRR